MEESEKQRIEVEDTRKAIDMYDRIQVDLEALRSYEVKVDMVVNLAKYVFRQKVEDARMANDQLTDDEAVAIVQKECDLFCGHIQSIPKTYAEKLAERNKEPSLDTIVAAIFAAGGVECNCPKCRAARESASVGKN